MEWIFLLPTFSRKPETNLIVSPTYFNASIIVCVPAVSHINHLWKKFSCKGKSMFLFAFLLGLLKYVGFNWHPFIRHEFTEFYSVLSLLPRNFGNENWKDSRVQRFHILSKGHKTYLSIAKMQHIHRRLWDSRVRSGFSPAGGSGQILQRRRGFDLLKWANHRDGEKDILNRGHFWFSLLTSLIAPWISAWHTAYFVTAYFLGNYVFDASIFLPYTVLSTMQRCVSQSTLYAYTHST